MKNLFSDLFQNDILPGQATPQGTERYYRKLLEHSTEPEALERSFLRTANGLTAGRVGFGCYRIARNHSTHHGALIHSLLTTTNVIDTSTNYGDGSSEALVGDVLHELIHSGRMKRDEVIVVTKIGYIQGKNIHFVNENKDQYEEILKFSDDLMHSLDPRFLLDQLELSRKRLGLSVIDVVLLHNPEYYLKYAESVKMEQDEAKNEYLKRIRQALDTLHEEVVAGRIGSIGISSNTFPDPHNEYESTPLKEILEFAPESFRVIQFPANMMERGFLENRDESGLSLCERAGQANLWTLANRPLNAINQKGQLFRLSRMETPENANQIVEGMNHELEKLTEMEMKIVEAYNHSHFRFDERKPSLSKIFELYRDRIREPESFHRMVGAIIRSMQQTINHLRTIGNQETEQLLVESYVRHINSALSRWEEFVRARRSEKLGPLEESLGKLHPMWKGKDLSHLALSFLLSSNEESCPDTVLVGMRRPEYVDSVLHSLEQPHPSRTQLLSQIPDLSEIFSSFIE